MNIANVIAQIKANSTIFNGNIAGSADYATGMETVVSLPMPAAYVYPLEDSIIQTSGMGGSIRQEIDELTAVVVCIDNTPDRRGQAAVTTIDTIKFALFAALLNWNPNLGARSGQGMIYAGGHLIGMDRARLWWQFDFKITSTITQFDGFIPPSAPLEQVNIFDTAHANHEVDIRLQEGAKINAALTISATIR